MTLIQYLKVGIIEFQKVKLASDIDKLTRRSVIYLVLGRPKQRHLVFFRGSRELAMACRPDDHGDREEDKESEGEAKGRDWPTQALGRLSSEK